MPIILARPEHITRVQLGGQQIGSQNLYAYIQFQRSATNLLTIDGTSYSNRVRLWLGIATVTEVRERVLPFIAFAQTVLEYRCSMNHRIEINSIGGTIVNEGSGVNMISWLNYSGNQTNYIALYPL